ncbi:hypothetical protein AgCh_017272 [Apium graveolens]
MGRSVETMLGENSNQGKRVLFDESSHTGRGSGGGPGGGVSLGHPITGGVNWRFKKLEMPGFDGNNPDEWILRAEREQDCVSPETAAAAEKHREAYKGTNRYEGQGRGGIKREESKHKGEKSNPQELDTT